MQSTYQHDYVPPRTNRYAFLQRGAQKGLAEKEKVECQCVPESEIRAPKIPEKDCAAASEWTGIAPMGRLIEPRIIPTKFSPEQLEGMANDDQNDCFKMQPNRFLKILRTVYPDLYERLKEMPKDELNRRIEKERLYSTYQIDYCNMNEYPEGIYESLKKEEETSKINASKLLQRTGPCSEFRTNIMQELENESSDIYAKSSDPCEKAYKPFKIGFADSSRFIASGDNSHWRTNIFAKRANLSEYMDTISKNGCVIKRNNIHDHSKCLRDHCRHQLVHSCANMKANHLKATLPTSC